MNTNNIELLRCDGCYLWMVSGSEIARGEWWGGELGELGECECVCVCVCGGGGWHWVSFISPPTPPSNHPRVRSCRSFL